MFFILQIRPADTDHTPIPAGTRSACPAATGRTRMQLIPEGVTDCGCFVCVAAPQRRGAFLHGPLSAPTAHKPPPQHQTRTSFVGGSVLCRHCQSPRASDPADSFCVGIKCEADDCVCGANYDIAPRCQNTPRTRFLRAGLRG